MTKWRNAVTVILTASRSPAFTNTSVYSGCNSEHKAKEKTDFQILALKKSSESPVLGGYYVFPGGMVNAADSSDEWISVFKKFGYCVDTLSTLINNSKTKLPIFENNNKCLPNCISLRITAIREAFEECGVLLCKRTTPSIKNFKPVVSEHLNIKDIDAWRKKVLKNPKEFLNLCLFNDCYPDVTSLYLWSDWLTPSPLPVRFDSVFFTAFLNDFVQATPDDYEIRSLKWIQARDLLLEYYNGISRIHLPQLYEISRMANFESFSKLTQFAYELNGTEFEQWMGIQMFLKDGVINLLPGDELYPDSPDFFSHKVHIEEGTPMATYNRANMNRFVIPNNECVRIVANTLSSSNKHILPWCPDFINHVRGKL